MTTIVARRLADGSLIEVLPDGSQRPLADRTDWTAVDALTEEEIEAAAAADPDARPVSEQALRRSRRGPHAGLLRKRLRLSAEEFAERYHFPLDVLRDWESHGSEPDAIARAYLKAIAADPEGVAAAVASKPEAAE